MRLIITKENIYIFIFAIMEIGLIANVYGIIFGVSIVNSVGVWLIALAILAMLLFKIIFKMEISTAIASIIAIVCFSFVSMFINNMVNSISIIALFSFLQIPILFVVIETHSNANRIRLIALTNFIIIIMYLAVFFSDRSHMINTEYGPRIIRDLTLGYSNPNETGMHLFAIVCVFFSLFFKTNKNVFKISAVFISLLLIYLILLTRSRAAIIFSMAALLAFIYVLKYESLKSWFKIVSISAPIITFCVSLFSWNFFNTHLLFGQVINTGRIEIYVHRLTHLSASQLLFGDYGYLFQNSLNSYLSVFITIGLPSLLLFIYILYLLCKALENGYKDRGGLMAYFGILLTIIYSSFESASLVSGALYSISLLNLVILCLDGNTFSWNNVKGVNNE